ncbi:DNA topoisomerase 2 top-2 [Seminavis robusta]|uniref:DNA topoisomerase 2 n=1 Tax=Seminavis robusta TaxID=568900 RepID=A0A9N8F045_9STRA|nr:DNA topoisomerase 2 top-2 [Seminavis robusta]|eukprot:Sro2738_g335950.1 DNA topoisomerase 2 top-2 (1159) ;mRNA; f:459-4144
MLSLRQSIRRRIRFPAVSCATPGNPSVHFGFGCHYYRPSLVATVDPTSGLHHEQFLGSRYFASSARPQTLEDRSNDNTRQQNEGLSIEEQYSRKTPLEHVLLRPGMYVGACERLPPNTCWVLSEPFPLPGVQPDNPGTTTGITNPTTTNDDGLRMVQKEYGTVPALIKLFDEILVNASDNRLRDPQNCTRLDITIDPGSSAAPHDDTGTVQTVRINPPKIQVYNNGKGIPIQIHKEENMYVPELIFGNLMSGSNFVESEKRLTGGKNGFGAKLTNIFSKSFTVETLDSQTQQRYTQTWYNNMTECGQPVIEHASDEGQEDYTCITFEPDIPRLTGNPHQHVIRPEDYHIMCRRVVDIAGCHDGLHVTLNGRDVAVTSFDQYSQLYRSDAAPPMCFEAVNPRWHVGVGLSETGSFESVSFVNGMSTHRGGTHVNAIANQIIKRIQDELDKKYDADLVAATSPSLIRRSLFLSVRSLIENPDFDSQMKEYLTSSPDKFGSSCLLSKQFLNTQLVKPLEDGGPGIIEEVVNVAKGRQQAQLLKEVGGKKTRRQLLSIPKLEDAHKAGSHDAGKDCTLILTEGDSAKALAVAGFEVVGRSHFGVFPLRGKFLNVRDAKLSQLTTNAEVKALVAILGLDFDKEYDTIEERAELRYGHVMLMTDQDTDGSHIKGLVINFFRYFWPKLLKPPVDRPTDASDKTFLSSFITPLLKATKKGKRKEVLPFYSMAEYDKWRNSLSESEFKTWNVKYFKGLGTSTASEAKEYFTAYKDHFRPFHWHSDSDGAMLDMVFDKSGAAERRDWINETYDPQSTVVVSPEAGNAVSYEDFVNKEMIHFSNADNVRSLPSVIDGLKPSQRKVLYAAFKRKLKNEIKVAQLSGYCAEHTAYHHGEASLQSTITGLAQDFVGSNNINLLQPSGQFGTRLTGGKDAASPRYIFTCLSEIARYLFPEEDDVLLRYLEDDGQMIEPQFYCPILPMLLVNGSQGIGTGWSTQIPSFDPADVLEYIRARLDGLDDLPAIRPYAKGFEGRIEPLSDGRGFATYGRAKKASASSILIDELPLKCWTSQYKRRLIKMRNRGEIGSFVENHTTTKVSFKVKMKPTKLERLMKNSGGLETAFKLKANLATTNMNAFDATGAIRKFESAEEIAECYFPAVERGRDRADT